MPKFIKTFNLVPKIIKTFDLVPKKRFDLVAKLIKTFDLVVRSSAIPSSDHFPYFSKTRFLIFNSLVLTSSLQVF
jgi:hypothetical protein